MKKPATTVLIRVSPATRKRLKLAATKAGKTLIQHLEELSKKK